MKIHTGDDTQQGSEYKTVKIKATNGKHMIVGKVYEVTEKAANSLINKNVAVKAEDSEEIGKIYKVSKKVAAKNKKEESSLTD